jgi:hypothetical protein
VAIGAFGTLVGAGGGFILTPALRLLAVALLGLAVRLLVSAA